MSPSAYADTELVAPPIEPAEPGGLETTATPAPDGSTEATESPETPSSEPEPAPSAEPAKVEPVAPAPTASAMSSSVRVEENHASLSYAGSWHSATGSAASGGTYRYSGASSATVTFRFRGTGLAVIGPVGPTYGRFEVWIDGVRVATVSQYAAAYAHQRVVWSISGLANADHTVVLKVTGTKDAASGGTIVVLDAFDISGTLAAGTVWLPGGSAAYEESDPRAFREGRWAASRTSAASGGSVLYTGIVGSTFTVHFSGSRIAWIGPRFSSYGRADIYLDGVYQATVSQYAASVAHRQVIWSMEGLAPGRHVLTIKVLGQKDAASRGTIVAVDGFTAAELLVPRFEERDSRIKRSGTWVNGSSSSTSGGGYVYARHADAYAVVPFWGTSFRWIGIKGPAYGMAEVYLDGRLMGVVDLYASDVRTGSTVWSVTGLRDGYHAVVIRVLGRKAPESSGSTVIMDAFEFEGAGADPTRWPRTPLRVDERDDRLSRSGSWVAGGSGAASSGTYLYSSRAGSRITVTFTGTSVAWLGPVGPSYGHARIVLDGVTVATVSQYASTFSHQQAVWEAKGLADTVHTLTIHVLGTKDAASSGSVVVVDGFDLVGTPSRRFEEGDRVALRSGSWTAGSTGPASSGTYLYSNRAGSSITVTFIGTSVAWLGPVGPSYGHARVVLDGVTVGTVSQYAPAFSHQRAVWRAEGLADTVHTLTIHVLGTKDAASSGRAIVVDGFDVEGERVTTRGIIVAVAKQQLGKQYVWAATGPDQFDCSGLVVHAYRAAGVAVPRTSRQQWSATNPRFTTFLQLLPGDLCFSSSPSNIHHVGIYIGWGLSIHAPGTGRFVEFRTAHTYGCWGRLSAAMWPAGGGV